MRRVLFIAYHFPPCEEIGGSIRSAKFAEFLGKFNWLPSIIAFEKKGSPQCDEIISDITRVKSLLPFSKPFELNPYGWAFNVWRSCRYKKDCDVIYISCPPFPQAIAGVFLKKKIGSPLVLDLRDAWSLDPYQEGSRMKKFVYKYLFPKIEEWAFSNTDKIIMNTASMLDSYKKTYPEYASRMTFLPNGYDERDFDGIKDTESRLNAGEMIFHYCGRFGVGGRDPKLILGAFKSLQDDIKVKLIIYGNQPKSVLESITSMGLESRVVLQGQITHQEMIQKMAEADALLAYQEKSDQMVQAISGKTYEYLRSGKPILSIAPPGDNQDIITQYAGRYEVVTGYEVNDIASAIKSLYIDWFDGRLLNYKFENVNYSKKYERQELTKQLSQILSEVADG